MVHNTPTPVLRSPVPEAAKHVIISKLRQPAGAGSSSEPSRRSLSPAATPSSNDSVDLEITAKNIELIPIHDHTFQEPRKRIVSPASLNRFEQSSAFAEIVAFIRVCNTSVVGKTLTDDIDTSPVCHALSAILDQVTALRKATPPDASIGSSRFGNPAFRTFYAKIRDNNDKLHRMIPGLDNDSETSRTARDELGVYFQESWGNEKRIDYGSGMELNMACWLLCLCKLRILRLPEDGPAIVLRVFWSYIQVMRDIQSSYWLEPAGSHGVWGLDDYHFLPFLWGAGQLSNHRHLRPKAIHDAEIVEEFAPKYMYLACIQFINSVKTASLRWHSPMLDDISGAKSWAKVNEGMIKMYRAEVLKKLPIAQHIFFGSLICYAEPQAGEMEDEDVQEDAHGHIHPAGKHAHGTGEGQAAGWGDCCGIPIPSAFAAAQEDKKRSQGFSSTLRGEKPFGSGVRRIPFD
ncbi:probable RRD2 - Activator of the phosphotyrosyl phosphatase activity of PP2A [Melanopsichium pennsylvanicum]|uniref:Serine/threonine-protein phosphatase 2A activator n=2 Tax=Melanopsichium pennsylvanicum TaxID=63383 RepID=A0AAJ5C679_9BASI|nr:probable RRD2-Activator of the phosphotyrosyl phosphatase activity of PP2A [Melanopsichium pennsylvanicum 4]SNX85547.1 probable RRD2 - Activator of the phosphotyrosyl phosphatase activity of PP2A [Melanopsichium pennsylvanicum]